MKLGYTALLLRAATLILLAAFGVLVYHGAQLLMH
jgi:hypothetical protein